MDEKYNELLTAVGFNEREYDEKIDDLDRKAKAFRQKANVSMVLFLAAAILLISFIVFFECKGNDLAACVLALFGVANAVIGNYICQKFLRLERQALFSKISELDRKKAAIEASMAKIAKLIR